MAGEVWSSGGAYERYVGRWSRLVAADFLAWLSLPPALDWLDVGCGTGALTEQILATHAPRSVRAVDLSSSYVAAARERLRDARVHVEQADATALPVQDHACDAVVSGIMLNFVGEPSKALSEMRRAVRPGGTVAAYVWDYAGQMQLMRIFWDAAVGLDPAAREVDEGVRFPLCAPEPLRALFGQLLGEVEVRAIDVPTRFTDFDDFWMPFEGGQGPAPGYLMSRDASGRARLREAVARRVPRQPDGSISLVARAWAVKGARQ